MKRQKNNKFILILLIIIISFTITIVFYYFAYNNNLDIKKISPNKVIKVIDGDTFELSSGEIVRLICIDTPEKNEKNYEEASNFLANLILNKEVRLEKDIDNKDSYNRSLRYVYVNITENNSTTEVFINREIIKQGYGKLFPYGNNTKLCNEISF